MIADAMFSSASMEWETPEALFRALDRRFHFTLDVCATEQNAKCPRYFSPAQDGLRHSWEGQRCWMNPPYGRQIGAWVQKAAGEAAGGALVVGLLPARTDTAWWQEYVQPLADVRFIRGRLKFGTARNAAPFPSAIAVWLGWPKTCGYFSKDVEAQHG